MYIYINKNNNIYNEQRWYNSQNQRANEEHSSFCQRHLKCYFGKIDAMSGTVADATSNVSAASEEQAASANEIYIASQRLTQKIDELESIIQNFTI